MGSRAKHSPRRIVVARSMATRRRGDLSTHQYPIFFWCADDRVWLDGDIEILRRCDAVMLTPDWQRSSGARAEVDIAESLGMPVFAVLSDLKDWLEMQVIVGW
jgi:hypothetical protein